MDQKLKAKVKRPLYEIIELVCNAKERKDKVVLLRQYSSSSLKAYLCYLFDPAITFKCLPPGDVPFRGGLTPEQMDNEEVRFALHRHLMPNGNDAAFVFFLTDRGRGNMPVASVQSQFERLYQNVHRRDGALLAAMKDKKPPVGLTRKVIAEAFPGMVAGWAPEPAEPGKKPRGRPPGQKKDKGA